jgi:hypothetical protein
MTDRLQYSIASAIDPTTAEHRFVVVGSDEVLHQEAFDGVKISSHG